jgi:hypothetical protein
MFGGVEGTADFKVRGEGVTPLYPLCTCMTVQRSSSSYFCTSWHDDGSKKCHVQYFNQHVLKNIGIRKFWVWRRLGGGGGGGGGGREGCQIKSLIAFGTPLWGHFFQVLPML